MGLELEVEPELLPLPELPVLFFRKVAYGFELSCGEEDIPARKNGDQDSIIHQFITNSVGSLCDVLVTVYSKSATKQYRVDS